MPCTDAAIGRFERQNPTISVNVFGVVAKGDLDCEVYILRVSELHEREHEIDLLLIEEERNQTLLLNQQP